MFQQLVNIDVVLAKYIENEFASTQLIMSLCSPVHKLNISYIYILIIKR